MTRNIAQRCILALTALTLTLLVAGAAYAQPGLTIGLAEGTDPNGEPSYIATVGNTSGGTIPLVTVTYTMPHFSLPISPAPSGNCLFSYDSFHLFAVCTFANLGSGLTHDFVVAIHATNTGPQDVTALAQATGFSDVSAFTTSTINEVGLAEMQVSMTSTNPGKVGEPLVYSVNVLNIQDDTGQNVFAILALPKNTTFVSATKGCTHGTLVVCKIGVLNPSQSKTVTITVLPNVSGWTEATAGVRMTSPDRDFTNNSVGNSIWINP
jgi:uncharacterized repeat protein (TIGR01451 family)